MTRKDKRRLLLHSCCGPCSTAVIERLLPDYDITVFYFNPNITGPEEYAHRLAEQKRFIKEYREKTGAEVAFIEGRYEPAEFFDAVKGLEAEPEGGARCRECFRLRLRETVRQALEGGFDCFDTTLSVSPYKNYEVISRTAGEVLAELGITGTEAAEAAGAAGACVNDNLFYVAGNYKKKEGYKRSTELAREYGLYRQHFCGCCFSEREAEEFRARKAAEAGGGR